MEMNAHFFQASTVMTVNRAKDRDFLSVLLPTDHLTKRCDQPSQRHSPPSEGQSFIKTNAFDWIHGIMNVCNSV